MKVMIWVWKSSLVELLSLQGMEDEEMRAQVNTFLVWIMAWWYLLVAVYETVWDPEGNEYASKETSTRFSLEKAEVNHGLGSLVRMVFSGASMLVKNQGESSVVRNSRQGQIVYSWWMSDKAYVRELSMSRMNWEMLIDLSQRNENSCRVGYTLKQ